MSSVPQIAITRDSLVLYWSSHAGKGTIERRHHRALGSSISCPSALSSSAARLSQHTHTHRHTHTHTHTMYSRKEWAAAPLPHTDPGNDSSAGRKNKRTKAFSRKESKQHFIMDSEVLQKCEVCVRTGRKMTIYKWCCKLISHSTTDDLQIKSLWLFAVIKQIMCN